MHVCDISTPRRRVWSVKLNWSRELTFSKRKVNYIKARVSDERGVYCIYAKNYLFKYTSPLWPTARWSRVVYIGSGQLHKRLRSHLTYAKNDVLAGYPDQYEVDRKRVQDRASAETPTRELTCLARSLLSYAEAHPKPTEVDILCVK
jgi:hypothetical protein